MASVFALEVVHTLIECVSNICAPNNTLIIYAYRAYQLLHVQ